MSATTIDVRIVNGAVVDVLGVLLTGPRGPGAGGAGVTDGDKGDVEVSGSGSVWAVPGLAALAAVDEALDGRLDTAETILSGLGTAAGATLGTGPTQLRTNAQNEGTYAASVLMDTGNEARPNVSSPVLWVGSVEPANAIDGDVWEDPAGIVAAASFAPIVDRRTAAAFAAANPVLAAGVTGHAYDADVLAMGNGITAWNSLPKFRPTATPQYAWATVAQTGLVAAATAITGLTVTFTVGAQPWEVVGTHPYILAQGAAAGGYLVLTDGAATITRYGGYFILPANGNFTHADIREVIDTPGVYTRLMGIGRAAGTLTSLQSLSTVKAELTAKPLAS